MVEHVMEKIARVTKKNPVEVRMINMNPADKEILLPMIDELKKTSDYDKRLRNVKEFNQVNIFLFFIFNRTNLLCCFFNLGKSLEKAWNFSCTYEISFRTLRSISLYGFHLCKRRNGFSFSRWY